MDSDDDAMDFDLGLVKTEMWSDVGESESDDDEPDKHDGPSTSRKYNVKQFVGRSESILQSDGVVTMKRGRGRPRKTERLKGTRSRPSLKTKNVSRPVWKENFVPNPMAQSAKPNETRRRGRGRPKKNPDMSTLEKKDKIRLTPIKLGSSSTSSPVAVVNSESKRDRRVPKRYVSESEEEDDDNFKTVSPKRSPPVAHVSSTGKGHSSDNIQLNRKRGRGRPRKNIFNPTEIKKEATLGFFDFESSSDEEESNSKSLNHGGSPPKSENLLSPKASKAGINQGSASTGSIGMKRGRGRPKKISKKVIKSQQHPINKTKQEKVENTNSSPFNMQRGRGRPKGKSSSLNYSARFSLSEGGIKRKLSPIPSHRPSPASKKLKLSVPTPTLTDGVNSQREVVEPIIKLEKCDRSIPTLKTPRALQKKTEEEAVSTASANRRRGRPRKSELNTPGSAHLPLKKRGRPRRNINSHIGEIDDQADLGSTTMETQISHGLEVCVDNIQSIVNAVEGGAARIELCSALSEGGLTPTVGLLIAGLQVTDAMNVPIYVMIRPRCGDFVYSEQEMQIMEMDIKSLKAAGADGFVFGVLNDAGDVDVEKCARLLKSASPLPSTFHRAFDLISRDAVHKSLETIVGLGFQRILTSGLQPTAQKGISLLKELVIAAQNRIVIMAGAGVNPENVEEIVKQTGVKEVHGSARIKIKSRMTYTESQVSMGKAGEDDSAHWETNVILVKEIVSNLNAELENEGQVTSCNEIQKETSFNISETNKSSTSNAHSSVMDVDCEEVVQKENGITIYGNDNQQIDDVPATLVHSEDDEMESDEEGIHLSQNLAIGSSAAEIINEVQNGENGHLDSSSETRECCLDPKTSVSGDLYKNGDDTNGTAPEDLNVTENIAIAHTANLESVENEGMGQSEYTEDGGSESTPAELLKNPEYVENGGSESTSDELLKNPEYIDNGSSESMPGRSGAVKDSKNTQDGSPESILAKGSIYEDVGSESTPTEAVKDSEYIEDVTSETIPAETEVVKNSEFLLIETANSETSETFQDENTTGSSTEAGLAEETYNSTNNSSQGHQIRPFLPVLGVGIEEIDELLSYSFS